MYGITEDVEDASLAPVAIDSSLADGSTDTSRKRKIEDQLEGSNKDYNNVE